MARPTLAAIVTAHKATPFGIMENLARQTVLPTQVLVGVSEFPLPWVVPSFPFKFTIVDSPDERDFGYRKRNRLLGLVEADYVGFFCHDDSYDGDYIEKMLDAVDKTRAGAVYCAWSGIPDCEFKPCESTLGNFFVKREIIEEIGGFPAYPPYKNEGFRDARLIEEIRKRIDSVARVNVTMYYHNKPYISGIRTSSWGVIQ
jgi:hypothetical protein